jgi:hypothetical protein
MKKLQIFLDVAQIIAGLLFIAAVVASVCSERCAKNEIEEDA